jgi:hypothetical protein
MGTRDDDAKRAEYRSRIEAALNRSRLATDPTTRRAWEKLAEQWRAMLDDLEEQIAFREPDNSNKPS